MQVHAEKVSETLLRTGSALPSPGSSVAESYLVHETLLEQGSGSLNEDALRAASQLSIVCDGATSLGNTGGAVTLESCGSGGQKAATITASVFADNPEQDLSLSARTANSLIRAAMIAEQVDMHRREHLWSTSFAAVQIRDGAIRWCQIGDCAVVAVFDDGSSELLTEVPNQDKAILNHWQRVGPGSSKTIHQELAGDIIDVRKTMNRAFGSLNGEPDALDFLSCGCLEDDGRVSDILLFSDGLFPPSSDPARPLDAQKLVELYQTGGMENVRNHVRRLQQTDPSCCIYPRFKKFDDISAVALKKNLLQQAVSAGERPVNRAGARSSR